MTVGTNDPWCDLYYEHAKNLKWIKNNLYISFRFMMMTCRFVTLKGWGKTRFPVGKIRY
jgi:ABC-type maltose transport system permease subunit